MRAWWRVRTRRRALGQRLDLLYTVAIIAGDPRGARLRDGELRARPGRRRRLARALGPALALVAVLLTARWGGYQGPVVFSVADVTHLLGAPLPRRGLAAGRLARALAAARRRARWPRARWSSASPARAAGIAVGRAAGLVAGVAELGVLGVAAAWAVRALRALGPRSRRRAIWPAVARRGRPRGAVRRRRGRPRGRAVVGAVGLGAAAGAGPAGRRVAAALVLLTLVDGRGGRARAARRRRLPRRAPPAPGRGARERARLADELRRPHGPLALETVGRGGATGAAAGCAACAASPRAGGPGDLAASSGATPWRRCGRPGRVLEGAVLAARRDRARRSPTGDRVLPSRRRWSLVYFGAARLLWPLRAELDRPARARILLRPRLGRIVAAHLVVPVVLVVVAAALGARGARSPAACRPAGAPSPRSPPWPSRRS